MKIITHITLLIAASFLFISCNGQPDSEQTTDTNNEVTNTIEAKQEASDVDVTKFAALIGGEELDGTIVDVRRPDEFSEGTINGALNINFMADDFTAQINKLDKSSPVYIFCRSGGRSGQAKKVFLEEGFTTIYNLEGGYLGWSAAGN